MIIDCHVHVSALVEGHGKMSERLLRSMPFRFMRRRFGFGNPRAAELEAAIARKLAHDLNEASEIDAAVILAFDAVYGEDGTLDEESTHLYVTNDYVIELVREHPKMLFGASIHPYRADAVAELERCVSAGAVLIKWLPITQGFDPSHPLCEPFYEALAHFGIPLLSHTGWEKSLPNINRNVADPALLLPALARGVTVIAAHCGTRSMPSESCFVSRFIRMARDHEHFYGDTAALNLPTRSYAWPMLLDDDTVRPKLLHGSDWPIVPIPDPRRVRLRDCVRAMREMNWIRRDVLIKRELGLDDAYWKRLSTILRVADTSRDKLGISG